MKIGNIAQTLKPALEGAPEVVETSGLVGVVISGEANGLLLCHNGFISVARMLKPTLEGDPEVIENTWTCEGDCLG